MEHMQQSSKAMIHAAGYDEIATLILHGNELQIWRLAPMRHYHVLQAPPDATLLASHLYNPRSGDNDVDAGVAWSLDGQLLALNSGARLRSLCLGSCCGRARHDQGSPHAVASRRVACYAADCSQSTRSSAFGAPASLAGIPPCCLALYASLRSLQIV